MEAVSESFKGIWKSSEDFTKGLFRKREKPSQYNPIEILKRLQREAFSDIMKLRDRQEKVERMVSFHKSAKGSPFQERSTHVHGMVDMGGALLFVDNVDEQNHGAIKRTGMRTGIHSRFTFETVIGQKDSVIAELSAGQDDQGGGTSDGYFGSPLSLTKVMYSANVKDWLSAVVVPWGARCKDVAITSNPIHQERSLTEFSSFGPPMLNQCHGAAMGIMVKQSNIAASLAELVSEIELYPNSSGIRQCFTTFGQVIYQLSKGTTLTLLGLHKKVRMPYQQLRLSKFNIPLGSLRRGEVHVEDDGLGGGGGSMGLILESELDESTRAGGWVEVKNSNPRCLQWAVSMSDTPEDEIGWGVSLGGIVQGPSWDHFQAEAFLKFNMGKRCSLQPGIVYVMDGATRVPALMLRSNWAL
ncbi:hypothetical protein ACHQM5_007934 [Ranunculus cassubicifolius]